MDDNLFGFVLSTSIHPNEMIQIPTKTRLTEL